MVDVPQSIKKKKRIRSMFSPEQSKLIRSKALPASGSEKEVTFKEKGSKDGGQHKKKSSSESEETYRFEIDLSCDRENDKYPEISFSRLVETEQNSEEEEESEEDQDVKRMSEYFEKKYGSEGGRRRTTNVNIDHGYDTSDSFVDDSEAFDEVIPDELDTQHGGFYINFGDLMFKKVALSESDEDTTEAQNRKRKRDEEDRKQRHKKMKTMKIKEKYKKMDKEVKLKKRKIIVEEDSTDSDITIVKPTKPKKQPIKDLKNKRAEKKQNTKAKETNKTAKTAEVKAKKSDKKPSAEKKVAKKKSKDILEEERTKVLELVERHKPFGDDKLPLITENLASIEFELRRNHNHSRRAFYEDLIKRMGENCSLDYNKVKNLAFSALTKRHAAALEEALVPLKKAVSAILVEIQPSFERRYATYLEKLESWKSAQAQQTPGEELVKPKSPAKSFKWDDTTRALYGKVVQVKFSQLKLIRAKPDEQSDLMKRYMKSLAEDVWSGGWVTTSVLVRESQPYCRLFANGKASKKKPAVSANSLKTTAKPAKLKSEPSKSKSEPSKSKSEPAKSKSEPAKSKPDQVPKQNSTSKSAATDQVLKQNSATKGAATDQALKQNSTTKSISTEKVISKFDAALSESPKSSASSSNSKPQKERTQSSNVSNNSVSEQREHPSSSPSLNRSLTPNKPTSTAKSNSSKSPAVTTAKSRDQADIAIIKSNINKINANLNRTVPSITIPDKPSTSPTPTSSPSARPNKTAPLKLNSSKPQPKSAKTASDRPIVSVPAMSHLISPRNGPAVKLTSDHIPPDFINNLLKKYGTEKLHQIKSQGLFPALLKEELLQVKSNSNAVIIIDDDAASPKKTPPRTQQSVTSSSSQVTSSSSQVTSSQCLVTSSSTNVNVPSSSLKSTASTQKTVISSPKVVSAGTLYRQTESSSPSLAGSNKTGPSKLSLSSSSTISVIEKSSKTTSTSKTMSTSSSEGRTSHSFASSSNTPHRQTIPVNVSIAPRTSATNTANNTANGAVLLTDSRPSILITKSTLPSSAVRSNLPATSVKPAPACRSPATSTSSPGPSQKPGNPSPGPSQKPGNPSSNLQSRLSQLMNNSAILQASPHSQTSVNNSRVPQKQQPTVASSDLCISKPANLPTSSVKPSCSTLSLSKGNSAGISLGTILSQHPNIDSQTWNKTILKSVAAKLQSFKESKEKE